MGAVLETERLILRGWRDEDAASLFKYASDEHIGPMAGWPVHRTMEYSRAFLRTVYAKDEYYAICLKGEDNPIGSIGLTLVGTATRPLGNGEAEMGYWVGYPYWGRGIAPEAAKELIRHGFEDLSLDRIFCGYFHGNDNSRRVQEKCGFVNHHTNKESVVFMLGETRVEHISVITKERFQTQKRHKI